MKRKRAEEEEAGGGRHNPLEAKYRRLEKQDKENKHRISVLKGQLNIRRVRVEKLKRDIKTSKAKNAELEDQVKKLEEYIKLITSNIVRQNTENVDTTFKQPGNDKKENDILTTQNQTETRSMGSLKFESNSDSECEDCDCGFEKGNENILENEEDIEPIEKASTEDTDFLSDDDEESSCDEDEERAFIKLRKSYSENLSAEIENDEERKRQNEYQGNSADADKVKIMELEEEIARLREAFMYVNESMEQTQKQYNETKEAWLKFNEEAVMLEKMELFDSLVELMKELDIFKKSNESEVSGCENLKKKLFETCAKLSRIKLLHTQIKKSLDSPFKRNRNKKKSASFDISHTPLKQNLSEDNTDE